MKECDLQKTTLDKSNNTSKTLLDAATHESRDKPIADQDTVQEEVKFLRETFKTVSEKLADLKKQSENIEKEVNIFHDKERALDDLLDEVDHVIENKCIVSTIPEKCAQDQQTLKVAYNLDFSKYKQPLTLNPCIFFESL